MERLTKRDGNRVILGEKCPFGEEPNFCTSCGCNGYDGQKQMCPVIKMLDRLAAYEDTELVPTEIAELKERTRWIPVSERMPEKEQWCHIAIKTENGYRVTNDLFAIETADHFKGARGFCKRRHEIVYWMPYPEPPEEEK